MKKTNIATAALLTAVLGIQGCELAYKRQAQDFVQDSVQECNGKVEKVALVQDGANRLTGLAEVDVEGEKYKTTLEVKTGVQDAIISMDEDICAMHSLKTGIRKLGELFQ